MLTMPRGRPLTYEDLAALPEDDIRYELIDGTLVVGPSPRSIHQTVVTALGVALVQACPSREFRVFVGPLDVVLAPDTVLVPDLVVARRSDVTEQNLPAPPLLAVEVLSPSSRRIDLMLKHSRLEAAGCPSYWVVDPDEPRLIAWELREGVYVQIADVAGAEVFRGTAPYPIEIVPAELVADA